MQKGGKRKVRGRETKRGGREERVREGESREMKDGTETERRGKNGKERICGICAFTCEWSPPDQPPCS